PRSTLFPYTTLFRSASQGEVPTSDRDVGGDDHLLTASRRGAWQAAADGALPRGSVAGGGEEESPTGGGEIGLEREGRAPRHGQRERVTVRHAPRDEHR